MFPITKHLQLLSAALFLFAPATPAVAQWLKYPTPGIPRLANGAPDLKAPAPRTPEGKPDLFAIANSIRDSNGKPLFTGITQTYQPEPESTGAK